MSTHARNETMKGGSTLVGAAFDKLHGVREAVAGSLKGGLDEVRHLEVKAKRYVQRKPLSTLLIAAGAALGAGLILGRLIRRK